MQHRLGTSSFRLPSSEAELEELLALAEPLFSGPSSPGPDAAQLGTWAGQQRQQDVTQLDWPALLTLLSGDCSAKAAQIVASLLSWAAGSALQELGGGAQSGGGADPRCRQALQNTLKLSLAFLCAIAKGQHGRGKVAGHEPEQQQQGSKPPAKKARAGGGGGGDAAGAALAQLQLRRGALEAILTISQALAARGPALLPAVSDLGAADRLARSAALHCLVNPLAAGPTGGAGGSSAKAAGEACYRAMAGILSRPFLPAVEQPADGAQPSTPVPAPGLMGAAGAVLQELLGVVSEPKQAAQVSTAAARLLGDIAQQSSRAAVAIAGRLTDRCTQLAAESSKGGGSGAAAAAALAGQRLDACLQFATLLVGAGAASSQGGAAGVGAMPAALLLCLPRLLPLARQPRSSTRRLALELFSCLLAAASQLPQPRQAAAQLGQDAGLPVAAPTSDPAALPEQREEPQAAPLTAAPAACQSALLAALLAGLADKDATLRAKAISCLERHLPLLAACLSEGTEAGQAGSGEHLGAAGEGQKGREGSAAAGDAMAGAFLQGLRFRLCDKSPSVRRRALALLAALTDPKSHNGAAGKLAPAGAARLAGAVLPVTTQLLRVRPDSALHPGGEGMQALGEVVLRLAGRSSGPSALLPLLALAGSIGDAAAQAKVQGAVLGMLLPSSGQLTPAQAAAGLLCNLAAALPQCSRQQVGQLRRAVQASLQQAGAGSCWAAGAVSEAVRACYRRLHAAVQRQAGAEQGGASLSGQGLAGAQEGGGAQGGLSLEAAAGALFVLGPFSSSSDAAARQAEARLLLSAAQHLASSHSGSSDDGSGSGAANSTGSPCWLLESLALAFKQLQAAGGSPAAGSSGPGGGHGASDDLASLAGAAVPALLAVLLSPASETSAVRAAALEAALTLPAGALAAARLLQCLASHQSSEAAAAAAAEEGAGPALHARLRPLLQDAPEPAAGAVDGGTAAQQQEEEHQGEQGEQEGHPSSKEPPAGAGASAAAEQRAVLAALELLGRMAAGYEQQRAAFRQRLAAEAAAQQGVAGTDGPGRQQAKSKAGRPLRPAGEWWVGDGQQAQQEQAPEDGLGQGQPDAATASLPAGAGTEGAGGTGTGDGSSSSGGGASFDYMRGEDQAAKQEAAAQRFLESLLSAGDTAPACYLPLLERLAGGELGGAAAGGGEAGGGGSEGRPVAVPAAAAALASLGRLAVLSEPLCRRAVQLAERCLAWAAGTAGEAGSKDSGGAAGGTSTSGTAACVQLAAVSLLADAIDAYPNAFGCKLPLVGRLMSAPAAADRPANSRGSGTGLATPAASAERLATAAAGAYCRLLLRGKLKLQDRGMLCPLGCALAAGAPRVAGIARTALAQLLHGAPPKGRAALCLDLFHQTPLAHGWRRLAAEELVRPGAGLLSDADLRSDVLAGQALQALLSAASACSAGTPGAAAGEAGTGAGSQAAAAGVEAAAALLRAMRPSAKVLATLSSQLQGTAGAAGTASGAGGTAGGTLLSKLPAAARQALAAFVANHVSAAGGSAEEPGAAPAGEAGASTGGAGGAAGQKRKRAAASSASLQAQLLQLLRSGGPGRAGRPQRRAGTAGGAGPAAHSGLATPATSKRAGGSSVTLLAGGPATSSSSRGGPVSSRTGGASAACESAGGEQSE